MLIATWHTLAAKRVADRHFSRSGLKADFAGRTTHWVNSLISVAELAGQGLVIGLLPFSLAQERPDLMPLTEALAAAATGAENVG